MSSPAVEIQGLIHRYGDRTAIDSVDLALQPGEVLGLLGPNGGGKTTLFRILCTLLPLQEGRASVLGFPVDRRPVEVRRRIGITFQSPSLDGRLTVAENLKCQAHLYGLHGGEMRERIDELLNRFHLEDRQRSRVETLSGGLKRRVELAKGLLHRPELLLLDEPSTGLDPAARRELWNHLQELQRDGMSILVTTHLMDEAERCDRVAILDQGRLVAVGPPDELRGEIGGEGVTVHCRNPEQAAARMTERFGRPPQRIGDALRWELNGDRNLPAALMSEFPEEIRAIEFGRPTMEDVFLAKTGHAFAEADR